jgi:hypothetical protein
MGCWGKDVKKGILSAAGDFCPAGDLEGIFTVFWRRLTVPTGSANFPEVANRCHAFAGVRLPTMFRDAAMG